MQRRCRGDHLASEETPLVGELVEDGEEGGYPLWGVDELGHYRDVAADREEAVTVGRMLAMKAPYAA